MRKAIAAILAGAILVLIAMISLVCYLGYEESVLWLARYTDSLHRVSEIKAILTPSVYRYAITFACCYLILCAVLLGRLRALYPIAATISQAAKYP